LNSSKKNSKREIKKNTMEKKQKIYKGTIKKEDAYHPQKLKCSTNLSEQLAKRTHDHPL